MLVQTPPNDQPSSGFEDSGDDDEYDEEDSEMRSEGEFNPKEEVAFVQMCQNMLKGQNWKGLAIICASHLEKNHISSFHAYFYYGISMYKQKDYITAIKAFEKAEVRNMDDAQLHYNLGLAYFKVGNY